MKLVWFSFLCCGTGYYFKALVMISVLFYLRCDQIGELKYWNVTPDQTISVEDCNLVKTVIGQWS